MRAFRLSSAAAARLVLVLLLALCVPGIAEAQRTPSESAQRIRERQSELERIRAEREALERRQQELQRSVRSLSAEVRNLERQADLTAQLVITLDDQLAAITEEIDSTSVRLDRTQQELVDRRDDMQRRVREIYKRGPLFSVEALLAAESFGELLARYKYLHHLARRDRAVVRRVESLRDEVALQREQLVRLQDELALNREEKALEEERLRALEAERQRSLASARRSERQTAERLRAIAEDERRISALLASLEEERRREEAAARARGETAVAAASSRSTLTTADFGTLAWPVDGDIIYRFGRVENPDRTVTRWNGIGIAAPAGTSVKALSAGEVALAERLGTYGLTVIVQHGGGDYSVYASLGSTTVTKGQQVQKGQVIGTVGVADPELGPHLHLEIRRDRGQAVDPLQWLRGG
jgi:septal ring factor EnvC (AmiA/AmiB activator)